jgi:hypothetical protein
MKHPRFILESHKDWQGRPFLALVLRYGQKRRVITHFSYSWEEDLGNAIADTLNNHTDEWTKRATEFFKAEETI